MTIESWAHSEGKIWVVQDTQMVIYTQGDSHTFREVLTKPLSVSQAQAIRDAISTIPQDAYGFKFFGEYSTHAPLLRLHFTKNGEWTIGRIEATGQLPVWAKPLLDAVSAACPPEWRVDFEAVASAYLLRLRDQENVPEALRNRLPEVHRYPIPKSEKEKKSWWEFWK